MGKYRLTAGGVVDLTGGWFVPDDPDNARWAAYQEWIASGGVPDAAIEPVHAAPAEE